MIDTLKELIASQFEAAFCMLSTCIEGCPEATWEGRVANLLFCQVAFHTLFYADLYLGPDEESLRRQPFHRANEQLFRDYEELEDREPRHRYEPASITAYLEHCRYKASTTVTAETEETLTARAAFQRRTFSRAELHLCNIRHIQHHAAQLSLRLRLDANIDVPWVGSGWRS